MPKKTAVREHTPEPRRREFLSGMDPLSLVEVLEQHFTTSDDAYWRQYAEARSAFLSRAKNTDAARFANLLDEVDDFTNVETAIRQAGFALGFGICRQLLLGELDVETLKFKDRGAR